MDVTTLAATSQSPIVLWYVTRATGMVALILLTSTLVLGIVASVGATTPRWPRFLSQSLHRDLSLFCLALVGAHVVSTVADGYVPIGYLDAVVPFTSPYRTAWIGLGAIGFDLLLAVAVTSGLRHRIGARWWRSVHWLAYLCWPIALLHGLGTGTDTRKVAGALLIELACIAAVGAAGIWRLVTGPSGAQRRGQPLSSDPRRSADLPRRPSTAEPSGGRVRVSRPPAAVPGAGRQVGRGGTR